MGMIQDVIRFSATFGYIIMQSAPHIYLSAAIFAPRESRISKLSRGEFRVPPETKSLTEILWDPGLLALNGHAKAVTSVAFSLDGKKIVSGSYDKTLRVWDAESGSIILGPLQGHTDWVTSVAFSPDGKKIVSHSHSETLLWDAESTVLTPHPLANNPFSFQSATLSLSLSATTFDNGWVVESYRRMVLWIPAHLRGDPTAAAVHQARVVWFDVNRLPIIVNGLELSWWSRNHIL